MRVATNLKVIPYSPSLIGEEEIVLVWYDPTHNDLVIETARPEYPNFYIGVRVWSCMFGEVVCEGKDWPVLVLDKYGGRFWLGYTALCVAKRGLIDHYGPEDRPKQPHEYNNTPPSEEWLEAYGVDRSTRNRWKVRA